MLFEIPKHSYKHINAEKIESLTLIGNLNVTRWAWNPFNNDLDMTSLPNGKWEHKIRVDGSNDIKTAISFRIVINHNPSRQLKVKGFKNNKWELKEELIEESLQNINFYSLANQELKIIFDENNNTLEINSSSQENNSIKVKDRFHSYQINGFVWDDMNMFEKFNPLVKNKSFTKINDELWSIDLPLKENGGIDFRSDGVYQFLISADFHEDFGFSAINDGKGTLINGTGFSSSHGTSNHSGCTVKIKKSGNYRINLHKPDSLKPSFSIESIDNISGEFQPEILNSRNTFQLLGSVFEEDSFNPLLENRTLKETQEGVFEIELEVNAGDHSINFAINKELFLDTMGLGCWFEEDMDYPSTKLSGKAWHGKPHEFNIGFNLNKTSKLIFKYYRDNDNFSIEVIGNQSILTPVDSIKSLSIVGDFSHPMDSWNPISSANLMNRISHDRFEKLINLEAGKKYTYKYVANKSNWTMVYADYELDCKGTDFLGDNNNAGRPTQKSLIKNGQLTSHGNPPPLEVIPLVSGPYLFYADITTGSYSVSLIK